MKKSSNWKRLLTGVLTVAVLGMPGIAKAETLLGDYLAEKDIEVTGSVDLAYYSKYVWRGFLLDDDPVIQPGLSFSVAGFDGGFWGSWDVDEQDALSSDEVDGWLGYSFDLGFIDESLSIVGVTAGHTWYGFPQADLHTTEWYLGFSLDTILSPYFTYYYDYGEEASGGAEGSYYVFGIGHSFDVVENYGITVDLGAEVGINDDFFIDGQGGYYLTTLGVTVPLTESLTMAPSMGYSVPFGDLEDSSGGNPQKEQFYAGVSVSYGF